QAPDLIAYALQVAQLLFIQVTGTLQPACTTVNDTEGGAQLMGDSPGHAADGDHLFIVLEPGNQLGFRGAVLIQIPVRLLDAVEHLVQAAGDAGDLLGATKGGAAAEVAPGHPL